MGKLKAQEDYTRQRSQEEGQHRISAPQKQGVLSEIVIWIGIAFVCGGFANKEEGEIAGEEGRDDQVWIKTDEAVPVACSVCG